MQVSYAENCFTHFAYISSVFSYQKLDLEYKNCVTIYITYLPDLQAARF
jgi:hypothetical protein